jgi:hypothetical protein
MFNTPQNDLLLALRQITHNDNLTYEELPQKEFYLWYEGRLSNYDSVFNERIIRLLGA